MNFFFGILAVIGWVWVAVVGVGMAVVAWRRRGVSLREAQQEALGHARH